jgi:hypothetical protein
MSSRVIREAIASRDGSDNDRRTADAIVAQLAKTPRAVVFDLLAVSGVEGVRPHDSRKAMLRRLWCLLTAQCRARERAEV